MDLMSLVEDDSASVVSAVSAGAARPGDPGGSSDPFSEIPPDITDPTLLARLRVGLNIQTRALTDRTCLLALSEKSIQNDRGLCCLGIHMRVCVQRVSVNISHPSEEM